MHEHDDTAITLNLPDEAATLWAGSMLAAVLPDRLIVYLEGNLGAGKTTLVRGLLRALGYVGKVKSPTYTFVEIYAISGLNLYHFDFYRIEQPREYLDAGFDEYFQQCAICLVEWPDRAGYDLPRADVRLRFEMVDSGLQGRNLLLSGLSAQGHQCLMNLRSALAGLHVVKSSSWLPLP